MKNKEDKLEINVNDEPNWSYNQIRNKGEIKSIKIVLNGKELFNTHLNNEKQEDKKQDIDVLHRKRKSLGEIERASTCASPFVLSEKVFRYDEEELEQVRNKKKNSYENIGDNNIFLEEDVKEFIRLLKKELCCDEEVDEYVVETKEQVINKLAGDLGK